MADNSYPSSFDPKSFDLKAELRIDYALVAVGVGAALIALLYLVLV